MPGRRPRRNNRRRDRQRDALQQRARDDSERISQRRRNITDRDDIAPPAAASASTAGGIETGFASGEWSWLESYNLMLFFIAIIFGIIGISTVYWTENKVENTIWGLEKYTMNGTSTQYSRSADYFKSTQRDVSTTTLIFGACGLSIASCCFLLTIALYNGFTDICEGIQPYLHRYGALLGGGLMIIASIIYANEFPFTPTDRFGYSYALFTTCGSLCIVVAIVKHAQFAGWYHHVSYRNPLPLYYTLYDCIASLLLLVGLCTRGWIQYKNVYFGLTYVEYNNRIEDLTQYQDIPSVSVIGTSNAALGLGAFGLVCCCMSICAAVVTMFGKDNLLEGRVIYLQPSFDIVASMFTMVSVVVYGSLFPELPGYHFSTSFGLVVTASIILLLSSVSHAIALIGLENLIIEEKTFLYTTISFAISWLLLLIAISTREWVIYPQIDVMFGLAKLEVHNIVYDMFHIPETIATTSVSKHIQKASTLALVFGSLSLILLFTVIIASSVLMLGKEKRYSSAIAVCNSIFSCEFMLILVSTYAGIMPKYLLGHVHIQYGFSYILAIISLILTAITTGYMLRINWGTSPWQIVKDATYPRTLGTLFITMLSFLLGIIGLFTNKWFIGSHSSKIKIGLTETVYYGQKIPLNQYSIISLALERGCLFALWFGCFGLFFIVMSWIISIIVTGEININNFLGKQIYIIKPAISILSTGLLLLSILSTYMFVPKKINMSFVDNDIRSYHLEYGSSFILVCISCSLMFISSVLHLWANQTETKPMETFSAVVTIHQDRNNMIEFDNNDNIV